AARAVGAVDVHGGRHVVTHQVRGHARLRLADVEGDAQGTPHTQHVQVVPVHQPARLAVNLLHVHLDAPRLAQELLIDTEAILGAPGVGQFHGPVGHLADGTDDVHAAGRAHVLGAFQALIPEAEDHQIAITVGVQALPERGFGLVRGARVAGADVVL